jgi:hypothetical protein
MNIATALNAWSRTVLLVIRRTQQEGNGVYLLFLVHQGSCHQSHDLSRELLHLERICAGHTSHECGHSRRWEVILQGLGARRTENFTPCVMPKCWAEAADEDDGIGTNGGFGVRLKARKMAEEIVIQDTLGKLRSGYVDVNEERGDAHYGSPYRREGPWLSPSSRGSQG